MNLDDIKTIHFVGIGGIGISAVAKLVALEGKAVSGSDISKSETLDELKQLGIKIFHNHSAANLPEEVNFLVYSSAVPDNNPEREKAKEKGVPQLSYFEFLGEISKIKKTIAVAGTHGKSTTTAMLGLMLQEAGFDPTVIVGSKVKNFPYQNLRYGKGEYLVVEACEHFKNFLHLRPQHLIINNIELDHTDCYKNINEIKETFLNLVLKLPAGGLVLLNNDNQGSADVAKKLQSLSAEIKIESFGLTAEADWAVDDLSSSEGEQKFKIRKNEQSVGEFILRVPGRFNVYNALAASALAMELGAPSGAIKNALSNFQGIWRRFEKVGSITPKPGEGGDAIIISDYGHHPTAIRETIKAARDFYPLRRIVLAFQPHQHNRTKSLFNDFVDALSETDLLILSEIFEVAGREETKDQNINSYELVKAIREKYPAKAGTSIYGGNLKKTIETILQFLKPNDLLIIMGAGDIYKIIPDIIKIKS